jgi:hypothetical protein
VRLKAEWQEACKKSESLNSVSGTSQTEVLGPNLARLLERFDAASAPNEKASGVGSFVDGV